MKQLILASASPRRKQLLEQINLAFIVRPGNVDESKIIENNPVRKVEKLAKLKTESIKLSDHDIVLAADTVVSYHNQIFEKPKNEVEAREMLNKLSNQTHEVYTGVALKTIEKEIIFTVKTLVTFWPLPESLISTYLKTDEAYDKAGAYGIQSFGAVFVKEITGDYYNVVGLPLSRVVQELNSLNYPMIPH